MKISLRIKQTFDDSNICCPPKNIILNVINVDIICATLYYSDSKMNRCYKRRPFTSKLFCDHLKVSVDQFNAAFQNNSSNFLKNAKPMNYSI